MKMMKTPQGGGAEAPGCAANQRRLIEELLLFPDSHERFAHVVERARRRPPLEEAVRIGAFEVEGCTSRLWLVPAFLEGRCWFRAQADSPIVHGMAMLLCDIMSGAAPSEILGMPLTILDDARLRPHLSPSRQRGMEILDARIRRFAEQAVAGE